MTIGKGFIHGTKRAYTYYKCRCNECKEANNKYQRNLKDKYKREHKCVWCGKAAYKYKNEEYSVHCKDCLNKQAIYGRKYRLVG